MGLNVARGNAKKTEVLTQLSASLGAMPFVSAFVSPPSDLAQRLVDACCIVTPPEYPRISVNDSLSMKVGGGGGAQSRKLGNLTVSVRTLLMTVPALLTSIDIGQHPWAAASIALGVLDAFWSHAVLDVQEREATVLWALWLNRDEHSRCSKDRLIEVVNVERGHHGRRALSHFELSDALDALRKLGSIEEDESSWCLRETVRIDFS